MAQPVTAAGKSKQAVFEDYAGFVKKFETKLTTDDVMTPPAVYDAVADWVTKTYGVTRAEMLRPFWPGGDYEKFEYPAGTVVVDNPPFSILARVIRHFCKRGVKFFLFAPHLTLFTCRDCDLTYIVTDALIRYEGGAKIDTGFITNLSGSDRIRTAPELTAAVEAACKNTGPQQAKYIHDPHVATAALLGRVRAIPFRVSKKHCSPISNVNSMKSAGKGLFGGGFLLSDAATAEKLEAERAAAKLSAEHAGGDAGAGVPVWELSDRERAIIAGLGGDGDD